MAKIIKRKSAKGELNFFNRPRMEAALKNGPSINIPPDLSHEEMRQFIINNGKK